MTRDKAERLVFYYWHSVLNKDYVAVEGTYIRNGKLSLSASFVSQQLGVEIFVKPMAVADFSGLQMTWDVIVFIT